MSKNLTKIENQLAEIDTYTDYCTLVDYQVDKAKEYVAKNLIMVVNKVQTIVAAFPYGVGPALIAAKLQITQAQIVIQDIAEQVTIPLAITQKLLELEPPTGQCEPNDLP